jgi:selenocysteine-specific elongation factor
MALHEADHYPFGFTVQAVASKSKYPQAAVIAFLEEARRRKEVEVQGRQHRLVAFKGDISKEDRRLLGGIEERIQKGRFATPIPADLAEELGRPKKRIENILTLLEGWGRVVKLAPNVYVHIEAVFEARNLLVAYCLEHGSMPSNQMKDVIGATRKYVIPLLEYFDAQGLTERRESARLLRAGYESVLVPGDEGEDESPPAAEA